MSHDPKALPHDQVKLTVEWALQEAYKIAVHHSGITNWSEEKPGRKHEVEMMQMEIAKMLLDDLRSKLKG